MLGKGVTNGNLRLRYRLGGAGAHARAFHKFFSFHKIFEILQEKSIFEDNPKFIVLVILKKKTTRPTPSNLLDFLPTKHYSEQ